MCCPSQEFLIWQGALSQHSSSFDLKHLSLKHVDLLIKSPFFKIDDTLQNPFIYCSSYYSYLKLHVKVISICFLTILLDWYLKLQIVFSHFPKKGIITLFSNLQASEIINSLVILKKIGLSALRQFGLGWCII